MKLNIVKKITELFLNRKKNQHVSKITELMFKWSYTVKRDVLESRGHLLNLFKVFQILYNAMDFYEPKLNTGA